MFLDRGVRTVQRWERELGLPVHRVGKGPRSPVHAFPSELTAWMLRIEHANGNHHNGIRLPASQARPSTTRISAVSRVLVHRSSGLVQELVNSMWEQKRRTDEILAALDRFQRRLNAFRKVPTISRKS